MRLPRFELGRVYEDGRRDEPRLVSVLSLPGDLEVGRRGFLGAGLTAGAALALIDCAGPSKSVYESSGNALAAANSCGAGVHAHAADVDALQFTDDGSWLLSASRDGVVKAWRMPSGKLSATIPAARDGYSVFSRNGCAVLTQANFDLMRVAALPSGRIVPTPGDDGPGFMPAAVSDDGRWVARARPNKTIGIWNVAEGTFAADLEGHSERIAAVCFSPDGKWLASIADDRKLNLWEIPSGRLSKTCEATAALLRTIYFSPDGKWLAVWNWVAGEVKVWEVPSLTIATSALGGDISIECEGFSPDGKFLVFQTSDNKIRLLGPPLWKDVAVLHGQFLSMSPDGRWLAAISEFRGKKVDIWALPSGERVTTLKGHDGSMYTASFSPDGKYIVTSSYDKTARLWDVATGARLGTLDGFRSEPGRFAFSPDGKWLALAVQGDVRLWHTESGEVRGCLFDPEENRLNLSGLDSKKKAVQYTHKNELGQVVTFTLPCGAPLPAGASCTCNCVSGEHSSSSSGGGWSTCTCNQVCTCVPVYSR
jgi:WD40 repeat protein